MSGYPMQLNSLLYNANDIYGGGFRVRNQAIGGHLGTEKQGPCISALIGGGFDDNIDIISWESFMNHGTHVNSIVIDFVLHCDYVYSEPYHHSIPLKKKVSTLH